MYEFFFQSCLVTVGVGTALGVAAVWVPDSWHEIGSKLIMTDGVLFVGAVAGALLCKLGMIG